MCNNFVEQYCKQHNLHITNDMSDCSLKIITEADHPVGEFLLDKNQISFYASGICKKSDLLLFILEDIKAH